MIPHVFWLCCLLTLVQASPEQAAKKGERNLYGDGVFQKIMVEWGEPSRGIGCGRTPILKVPFKLFSLAPNGSKAEVDWKFSMEVVMVREPGEQLDFLKPVKTNELVRREISINGNPKQSYDINTKQWIAEIDIAALNCPVGQAALFQTFLHIPGFSFFSVNDGIEKFNVIHKQSITTLSVPGPAKMNEIFIAINHCPTEFGQPYKFNPTQVLKAVNPLIRLGKGKAIEELQKYNDLAGCEIARKYERPQSSDTATVWCISVILDTIFDHTPNGHQYSQAIMVSDGIPFLTHGSAFFGSPDVDFSKVLANLVRKGTMLNRELIPSNNPLRAADALFEKLKSNDPTKRRSNKRTQELLCEQAWLMVKGHFPEVKDARWTDELLNERIKMVDAKGLKWNLQRNEYEVVGK